MARLFKVKVRKVGTSLGVLIPKELVSEEKLREGEEIEIGILKENRLKLLEKAFGAAKGAKPFERERPERERY